MDWGAVFAAGIFLIGFLSLLLVGINTLLNAKIAPIKELLSNHITETKAEIRSLRDRFDRLYDLLLQDRGKDRGKDSDKK